MIKNSSGAKKDRFPWRYVFYLVVFFYLAGDLYLFDGPISRAIDANRSNALENAPDESQWIATVNREPITKRQLEVAVMKHLFRRGKTAEELNEKNLLIARLAVLQKLVDDTLIRQYATGERFKLPQGEADHFITSFEAQFESPEDLEERSQLQKLDVASRKQALIDLQTQKRWIDSKIATAVEVTDEEALNWFEENHKNGKGFTNPERFHARHIFISTVIESGPERETLIRDIHKKVIAEGSDFTQLALDYSEDQRTRKLGGDLNWFTKERMPPKFMTVVSTLKPSDISEPFQTDIGWHIVEIMDRKPAEPLDYEIIKPEIVAHIESKRRAATLRELVLRLRQVAAIEFYQDRLKQGFPAGS